DGWMGGGTCVAREAPWFRLQELLPAPEAEAFDRGPPHKPVPDASARHVFKVISAAASTLRAAAMRIASDAPRTNIRHGSSSIRRSIDRRRDSGESHRSLGSAVSIGTTFGRHNR